MAIFQDVTLTWKGEEYTVKSNQIMRLIAKVEQEISFQDLGGISPPLAKISMAYAVVLQYAGCRNVIADDVYSSLFQDGAVQSITDAVTALMMIMVPPSTYQPKVDPKPKARTPRKKSAQ